MPADETKRALHTFSAGWMISGAAVWHLASVPGFLAMVPGFPAMVSSFPAMVFTGLVTAVYRRGGLHGNHKNKCIFFCIIFHLC